MTWLALLLLLAMALASCAEVEEDAARHPIHVRYVWHFPPGLHKPVPHFFPYSLPDKEPPT